jgi:hypothetical protein
MHNTSIMLTVTTLFAVFLTTVIGLSESAGAQGSLAETTGSESPFACNRLALTPLKGQAMNRRGDFFQHAEAARAGLKLARRLANGLSLTGINGAGT